MAIVFKDLQKLVSHSQQENTRKELFQSLQDKPFWIRDQEEEGWNTYLKSCVGNGTFELVIKKGIDTHQLQFLHIRTVYYS